MGEQNMSVTNPSVSLSEVEKRGRGRVPNFLRVMKKYWVFYLMMLPAIIILIINNYIPMLGTVIAFKDINYQKGILGSDWVGFSNFKYLFSTETAWIITRNTLLYNTAFIVLTLFFHWLLRLCLTKCAADGYRNSIRVRCFSHIFSHGSSSVI